MGLLLLFLTQIYIISDLWIRLQDSKKEIIILTAEKTAMKEMQDSMQKEIVALTRFVFSNENWKAFEKKNPQWENKLNDKDTKKNLPSK